MPPLADPVGRSPLPLVGPAGMTVAPATAAHAFGHATAVPWPAGRAVAATFPSLRGRSLSGSPLVCAAFALRTPLLVLGFVEETKGETPEEGPADPAAASPGPSPGHDSPRVPPTRGVVRPPPRAPAPTLAEVGDARRRGRERV